MTAELSPASSLHDALVILGAAGIVIPLFARFRITPVIGFILVGLLVGPFALGSLVTQNPWLTWVTISNPAGLAPLAEVGVVMLLFSVGLELSFQRLWALRKQVFGLGSLELLVCGLLIAAVLIVTGYTPAAALALGLALALSSTALVLKITGTSTPVGRAALSMLLFEDIALVPIVFLLGAMGRGDAVQDAGAVWTTLLRGLVAIAVLLALSRLLLPALFAQAARTKSPELFLAISLLAAIASAAVTGAAGLSPIVGALIAGLAIAETDYHGEVENITAPFKGLALGVFLITIGMAIDPAFVRDNWLNILIAVALVLSLKALITALLLRLMGARAGTSTEAGILMASPSETTLIVLSAAVSVHLILPEAAQFWQVVTAIGLTITPLLALAGKRLARRVDPAVPKLGDNSSERRAIIVGFGRVGRLVADMLKVHNQPYVAINDDPDGISAARAEGYNVVYGDASRDGALERLGLGQASAVILTMAQPVAVRRLVTRLRNYSRDLPIIARARDPDHAAALYRAGASHAVPETVEASLQLSEAVLVDLGVAMGPVIASIHEKRDEFRKQIMKDGELAVMPVLKTGGLREKSNS